MKITAFALAACLVSVTASAEVLRVDVSDRKDIPEYGYEQVTAKAYFSVDPKDPRNRGIADIDKAPVNKEGRVEFSADLVALWPKSAANDGSAVAIIDVVNRGIPVSMRLNRASGGNMAGDGFLLKRGIWMVAIGWEFDVGARNGAVRVQLPVATDNGAPIRGTVRAAFTPDRGELTYTVGDLAAYPAMDDVANDSSATLTVHDGL